MSRGEQWEDVYCCLRWPCKKNQKLVTWIYCIAQKFQGSKFSQITVFEIISWIHCTCTSHSACHKFSLQYSHKQLKIRKKIHKIKEPRKFSAIQYPVKKFTTYICTACLFYFARSSKQQYIFTCSLHTGSKLCKYIIVSYPGSPHTLSLQYETGFVCKCDSIEIRILLDM